MTGPRHLTPAFEEALLDAIGLDAGQTRKGSDTPYITHLMSVAAPDRPRSWRSPSQTSGRRNAWARRTCRARRGATDLDGFLPRFWPGIAQKVRDVSGLATSPRGDRRPLTRSACSRKACREQPDVVGSSNSRTACSSGRSVGTLRRRQRRFPTCPARR
jgi:hypothetical protein